MTTLETSGLDPQIRKALQKALARPMSKEDLHQQKVSFIVGTMADDSILTREKVEKILAEQEGQQLSHDPV